MTIPSIKELQGCTAQEAANILIEQGVKLNVQSVNWPNEYPACPKTEVRVGYTEDKLYIRYDVTGEQLRAVAAHDNEPVWCDSCVEFFCQIPGSKEYMNFETNCIGVMVASRREGRDINVRPFSPEQMVIIDRFASEGKEPFEEKDGLFTWCVVIAIPWQLITQGAGVPNALNVNFYKCADDTKQPHYVSWNPITIPHPDFHCPAFFKRIEF